jgi:O-antigen/teichoic acid export membrane protein
MMRSLRQLASESLVYGLAGMIARFLTILLVPVYTRIFTPEDYGVISLITTTMAVVAIVVVLALDNSAHRWYWDTEDDDDRKRTLATWLWCQLVLSLALAGVLVAIAPWLARTIAGQEEAAPAFVLAALPLPAAAFGTVVLNWLRMMRRPWATMGFSIVTTAVGIVATLVLVVGLGWGIEGVFAGQAVSALVGAAAAVALMKDWLDPRRFDWERLRTMLRFGLPLIPAALSFWVVSLADRYFVQIYASTAEVGLYAVGSAFAALVAFLTGAFQQAWGPFALSIHKQPDAKQVYAHVFLIYLWLTCAASTMLTLLAPEVLRLLATEAYAGASTVVGFLTLSAVLGGLTYIAAVGPAIVKTTAPTGVAATAAALLNIVLNFVFVPLIGMRGAALATLLSQAVVPLYLFYRSQQLYPIPYNFAPGLALLALAAALMALGGAWQPANLWLGMATKLALCALFLPAPLVLGILSPAQARGLLRAVRRAPAP